MKYNLQHLSKLSNLHVFELSSHADCACDNESAAQFLRSIADTVIEQTDDIDAEDWQRVALDNGDILHEIADNSPSYWTHEKWQQFVGTAAWREDVEEIEDDMSAGAHQALHQIAHRLALAIAEAISEEITDHAEVMA
jgi:hypothetical protein